MTLMKVLFMALVGVQIQLHHQVQGVLFLRDKFLLVPSSIIMKSFIPLCKANSSKLFTNIYRGTSKNTMNTRTLQSSLQKLTTSSPTSGRTYRSSLYHNYHNVPLAFIASTTNSKIKVTGITKKYQSLLFHSTSAGISNNKKQLQLKRESSSFSSALKASIESDKTVTTSTYQNQQQPLKLNLITIKQNELETLLSSWNQPKYRAKQILHWVHEMGITDIDLMDNLPKKLRSLLKEYTSVGSLSLEVEAISKDGTRKRAYRLWDGQLIESVLMPYADGRQTACISSQAGCAMGCVFCATGQMGFARQLTEDEIFEQVATFAAELKSENKRLSNVVMMGEC
jgi:hypothetical protein